MNKLISSTFLYCPSPPYLSPPFSLQQMEKQPGKRREGFSISEAKKPFYTSLCVLHYSNQRVRPSALHPSTPSESVKYMYNSSCNCFTTIKEVIADNQEAILRSE